MTTHPDTPPPVNFTFERHSNGSVEVHSLRDGSSVHVVTAHVKRGFWEWNANIDMPRDLRSAVEEMILSFSRRRN